MQENERMEEREKKQPTQRGNETALPCSQWRRGEGRHLAD